MTIKPLADRVLVLPAPAEEKTEKPPPQITTSGEKIPERLGAFSKIGGERDE